MSGKLWASTAVHLYESAGTKGMGDQIVVKVYTTFVQSYCAATDSSSTISAFYHGLLGPLTRLDSLALLTPLPCQNEVLGVKGPPLVGEEVCKEVGKVGR